MSNFQKALTLVLSHEGGYADNPADRGGPTNMGITLKTLQQSSPTATVEDLKALSPDGARAIYQREYWDALRLDCVSNDCLASVVLDLAVLRGVGATIHSLQFLLGMKSDGILGPETRALFFHAANNDPRLLAFDLILHTQYCLGLLVKKDPTQAAFIEGWLGRTQELLRLTLGMP